MATIHTKKEFIHGEEIETIYNGNIKVGETHRKDGQISLQEEYTTEGILQKRTSYNDKERTKTVNEYTEKGVLETSLTFRYDGSIQAVRHYDGEEKLKEEEFYNHEGDIIESVSYHSDGSLTRDRRERDRNSRYATMTEGYSIVIPKEARVVEEFDNNRRLTSVAFYNATDSEDQVIFFDKDGVVTRMEAEGDDHHHRNQYFNRQEVREEDSLAQGVDRRLALINGELRVFEANYKDNHNQSVREEFKYTNKGDVLESYKVCVTDKDGNKRETTTFYESDREEDGPWSRETLINGVLTEKTEKELFHNKKGEITDRRVKTTSYDQVGEVIGITTHHMLEGKDLVLKYDKDKKGVIELDFYQEAGPGLFVHDQLIRKAPDNERALSGYMDINWYSDKGTRYDLDHNKNKEIIEKGEGTYAETDYRRTVTGNEGRTETMYNSHDRYYEQPIDYFTALEKEPYKSEEKYDLNNHMISRKIRNENEETILRYENDKLVSRTTLKDGKEEEKIEYNEAGLPVSHVSNQGETTIRKAFDNRGALLSMEVKDENGKIVEDAQGHQTYYDREGRKINPMSDAEFEELMMSEEGQKIVSEMLGEPNSGVLGVLQNSGTSVSPTQEGNQLAPVQAENQSATPAQEENQSDTPTQGLSTLQGFSKPQLGNQTTSVGKPSSERDY